MIFFMYGMQIRLFTRNPYYFPLIQQNIVSSLSYIKFKNKDLAKFCRPKLFYFMFGTQIVKKII